MKSGGSHRRVRRRWLAAGILLGTGAVIAAEPFEWKGVSLFSLIAQGDLEGGADSEAAQRMREMAKARIADAEAAEAVASQETELADWFGKSVEAQEAVAVSRVVEIWHQAERISLATFLGGKDDWIVAPRDLLIDHDLQGVVVKMGSRSHSVASVEAISSSSPLVRLKLAGESEELIALPEPVGKVPATGSLVGTPSPDGLWQVGIVSMSEGGGRSPLSRAQEEALTRHQKRVGFVAGTRHASLEGFTADLGMDQVGGPVFDRKGKLVGVVLSRVDVHAVQIISAKQVLDWLVLQES
ncbi:MAG: hypothetical protein AAGA96_12270 [Verrucomicrobiota bacterium]